MPPLARCGAIFNRTAVAPVGIALMIDRFSVADGYLTTVLNWTRATPQVDLAAHPNVKAYLERMRARPSVAAL
jgi:glutathione S-transferase